MRISRYLGGWIAGQVDIVNERTFGFGGQNQNVVIGPLSKVEQSQVLTFGGLVCDVESSCYYYGRISCNSSLNLCCTMLSFVYIPSKSPRNLE